MQLLVGRALHAGGLDAAQVAYVAVHGTGTPLGDPIEVGALAGALAGSPQAPIIGSVKVSRLSEQHVLLLLLLLLLLPPEGADACLSLLSCFPLATRRPQPSAAAFQLCSARVLLCSFRAA